MMARWIRAGRLGPLQFDETWRRLAAAQRRASPPILLWAESSGVLESVEHYAFALIVPLHLAPGKRQRWRAWGLAPAAAAYRQFGVPAYLDDGDLWLHGRRISQTVAMGVGECLALCSTFLLQFPGSCVATPTAALEQAFRLRLEAQHGWQFEHSWPSEAESAVAVA